MSNQGLPCTKTPCSNCPFRKDTLKGWLGKRMEEILEADTFVCHKNTKLQCSGHMHIKGDENTFYKLARRMFSKFKLLGREKVFDSKEECLNHHKND